LQVIGGVSFAVVFLLSSKGGGTGLNSKSDELLAYSDSLADDEVKSRRKHDQCTTVKLTIARSRAAVESIDHRVVFLLSSKGGGTGLNSKSDELLAYSDSLADWYVPVQQIPSQTRSMHNRQAYNCAIAGRG
jgi:hypothetical protein